MKIKVNKKMATYLKIFGKPTLLFFLYIATSMAILISFQKLLINDSSDVHQEMGKIISETALLLLTTGTAIVIPLWIERNFKKVEKDRLLRFAISSLWVELRQVRHNISNIKDNFKFELTLNAPPQTIALNDKLALTIDKISMLKKITDGISTNSFEAMCSNSSISYIEDEILFNSISQAYEEIFGFKQCFILLSSSIKLQKSAIETLKVKIDDKTQIKIIQQTKDTILKANNDILYIEKKIEECIREIEKYFDSSSIKYEEIPRE